MALEALLVALALVAAAAAAAVWQRSGGRYLPPGPKRWPILGSFLSFPRHHVYDAFCRWQKEYGESPFPTLFVRCEDIVSMSTGDVVYISLLGQPIYIINTREKAEDLLSKRGHVHSHRPVRVFSNM
jgi:hypothetical protein